METGAGETSRPSAATAADETLKKNTDCIYFLASPLTCKKGNECEYRHSEGARVNPRDCWYWFNGSCLNPKCSFRHPPLDGLFGIPGPVSRSSEPPSKPVAPSPVPLVNGPAAQSTNKQNVPCYYFQKGHCSKGDRCTFVHKLQPTNSYVLQHKNEISVIQSEPLSNVVTNNSPLPKVVAKQNVNKAKEILPLPGKLAFGHQIHNKDPLAVQVSSEYASPGPAVLGSKRIPMKAQSQSQSHLSQPQHVNRQNGKEADDFDKESSPGSRNLAGNQVEDPGYFKTKDKNSRALAQGGMRSSIVNDYAKLQPGHDRMPYLDGDHYQEMRNHDQYEPGHEHFDRERLRSSVRTSDRAMSETSMLGRTEKFEKMDNLDLRHQLKQKRSNGLRSAVNFEVDGMHIQDDKDYMTDERYQTRHSKDGSVSRRLHGRIVLPSKLTSDPSINLRSQGVRETTGSRRKSPRPISSQPKNDGRMKERLSEDPRANNIFARVSLERDDKDSLDFAPPKKLSELKRARASDSSEDTRSLKSGRVLGHCKFESSLSFEGPKPLDVLLKKKRDISPITGSSTNVDKYNKDNKGDSNIHATAETLTPVSQRDQGTRISPEASRVASEDEEGLITEEGENLFNDGQHSSKGNAVGNEEGMITDGLDDQEFENYHDGNRESDGGEAEEADYKVEDDENVYQDYEDDDDDEDDFAKKVGIMLS